MPLRKRDFCSQGPCNLELAKYHQELNGSPFSEVLDIVNAWGDHTTPERIEKFGAVVFSKSLVVQLLRTGDFQDKSTCLPRDSYSNEDRLIIVRKCGMREMYVSRSLRLTLIQIAHQKLERDWVKRVLTFIPHH